ncbi:MAG: DUF305 domain-containing protein [Actinobacteria bacterium]|nr:DUF305 domain-containing protein [Actinomycetota bacterium]
MRKIRVNTIAAAAVAAAVAVLAITASGCGSNDSGKQSAGTSGGGTDAAFAREMIPHHEGAVSMAKSARKKAMHDEIRRLANSIISSQNSEIEQLRRIDRELSSGGVKPSSLNMSHAQMGMDFEMPMLDRARDFDKAFIDMMIPHHRGAIAMAQSEIADGTHAELRQLARAIISAQQKEIALMQSWRKRWYGAELPDAGDGKMDHNTMDHGKM